MRIAKGACLIVGPLPLPQREAVGRAHKEKAY